MGGKRVDTVFCPEKNKDILVSVEWRQLELGSDRQFKQVVCLERDKIRCRTSLNCPVAKMRK